MIDHFDETKALTFLKTNSLRFTKRAERKFDDGTTQWIMLLVRTQPRPGPGALGKPRHASSVQWRTRWPQPPDAALALNQIARLGNELVRPRGQTAWRIASFFTWREKSQIVGDLPLDNLHEAVI